MNISPIGKSPHFSFDGNISYDTIDAIRNGITARVILQFQLARGGGLFGSVKTIIKEDVEEFNISYDMWENNYIVSDRKRKNEYHVTGASTILKKIYEIINPISYSLSPAYETEKLLLRGKIKIQTIKLYPPFGIFLIFFNPWNYESSWIYSDFFTLEEL